MPGFGFDIFRYNPSMGSVSFDSDAQAFITAASITDPTQQSAVNQLVIDLKAASIWTKMKAVYPFVGGSASTHKWNLKDPRDLDAAFRLVFSGGWTHSSTGAKGNGTNGYADTFINPTSHLSQNSTHLSFYSRTNLLLNQVEMGVYSGAQSCYLLFNFSGIAYSAINSNETARTTAANPTTGLLIGSRSSSTQERYFTNNVAQTRVDTSGGLANNKIFLSCYNQSGTPSLYSSKECAFASIGDGLSDTDAANLYTAVQAFQTALSRNV